MDYFINFITDLQLWYFLFFYSFITIFSLIFFMSVIAWIVAWLFNINLFLKNKNDE